MLIYIPNNEDNYPIIFSVEKIFSIFVEREYDIDGDYFSVVLNNSEDGDNLRLQRFDKLEEINTFFDKLAIILGAINFVEYNENVTYLVKTFSEDFNLYVRKHNLEP